ncbi:MAG: ATP-grasp domain-containing protein [Pirellula sp.]
MTDPNANLARLARALSRGEQPLILAGASCRAAAQCARRAGYVPVVFDDFQDRDLLECAICFPCSALLEWSNRIAQTIPHAVAMIAGGMENRPELMMGLQNAQFKLGVEPGSLQVLRDPRRWQRWASESGLLFPATRWHEQGPPSREDMATSHPAWLTKSTHSAGGLGVASWDPRVDPPAPSTRSLLWQQHLSGISVGVSYLATSSENHCLGAASAWYRTWPWAPTPFIYRGSVGPFPIEPSAALRLNAFGERVRRETGIRGLWGADWMVGADGWWLLEINPRWSASMELLDAGASIPWVELHVRALQGDTIAAKLAEHAAQRPSRLPDRAWAKTIVYAISDWSLDEEDLAWMWERRWRFAGPDGLDGSGFADIPATADRLMRGTPVLSCLAQGPDVASAEDSLGERVSEVLARMG